MAEQKHEISLRVLKTSRKWLLSNYFTFDLKFQNAAQRRLVFVVCYVVKLLSCVS